MKNFSLGVLVICGLISGSHAGVNDFWQVSSSIYGATCSNGKRATITTSDGMICTDNGNTSKCNYDWSPRDAASWACR